MWRFRFEVFQCPAPMPDWWRECLAAENDGLAVTTVLYAPVETIRTRDDLGAAQLAACTVDTRLRRALSDSPGCRRHLDGG